MGKVQRAFEGPRTSVGQTLFTPIRVASGPIKWFLYIFMFIIGIILLILIIIFIYNGFTKGELLTNLQIKLEEYGISIPLARFFDSAYNILNWNINPTEDPLFGVEESTEVADFGLKITDFKTENSNVMTGETIIAYGQVEIGKTKNDEVILDLSKACFLEDYNIEGDTIPAIPSFIPIYLGMDDQIIDISCIFENGISENDINVKSKGFDTKIVRLLPSIGVSNQDVNWYPSVKSIWARGDKTEKTMATKEGPANLEVWSSSTQPFYENREGYILRLNLKANPSWNGNIKSINDIYINTGESLFLDTSSPSCDFVNMGGIYALKQDKLDKANIDCNSKEVLKELAKRTISSGGSLTYTDCIAKFKNEFSFKCPFKVMSSSENAERVQVKARADYTFEMIKATGVKVNQELVS